MAEHPTDIVAVVGIRAAERSAYASRIAEATGRMPVAAAGLRVHPDPIDEAIAIAAWADRSTGSVVELPGDTSVPELIRAVQRPSSRAVLSDLVCVVDALHLVDDLRRETYAGRRALGGEPGRRTLATEYVAHALLLAHQIEYASKIVLVNWEGLATPNLSGVMALVSSLGPAAALWLDTGGVEPPGGGHGARAAAAIQPGWVSVVNGSHRPRMTDPRIGALHYEQLRLFHPQRLGDLLAGPVDRGAFGALLRSAGFCRLSTRAETLAHWEQVGGMCSVLPLTGREAPSAGALMQATGQNLALFGIDLDAEGLRSALDAAVLTDAELADGPDAWSRHPDPFPAREGAAEARE